MAINLTADELKELETLLSTAMILKKERSLNVVTEMRQVEKKAKTHTVAEDEVDLGFEYVKVIKPAGYTLQANEKLGEQRHYSDVSIRDPYDKDKFVDGSLVVLIPDKRLVRKKTKEALANFEAEVWNKIDELLKKQKEYKDI